MGIRSASARDRRARLPQSSSEGYDRHDTPTYREIHPVYPAKSRLTLSDNPDKSMFVKFWLTAFLDLSFFNPDCS